MTKGNGTTANVHLCVVDLQLVFAVDGHAGESLVQLDNVAVIDGNLELLQQLGDGNGWANAHDARSETGNGGADELGHDRLAELDSLRTLHEEDGSSWEELAVKQDLKAS